MALSVMSTAEAMMASVGGVPCMKTEWSTMPHSMSTAVASAMNDVSRELGGAIGIAVIGSVLTAGYRAAIDDSATALPVGTVDTVRNSAAAGFGVAEQSGPDAPAIAGIVSSALADGFSQAMVVATLFLVLGAVYVGLRTPRVVSALEDRLGPRTTDTVEAPGR
jgi:hypothetical protein